MENNWTDEGTAVKKKAKRSLGKNANNVILVVMLFSLAVLCSLMVYFQMQKYINTQTTIATMIDSSNDKLELPSVAFCPGLKHDKIQELVWPVRIFNPQLYTTNQTFKDTFPTDREGMDDMWDQYTHNADEFFISINAQYQNWNYTTSEFAALTPKDLLGKEVGCLSLKQYGTPYGKCFSIDTLCKIKGGLTLQVNMNLTQVTNRATSVTLRQRPGYMGNTGYESGLPVHVGEVRENSNTDVVLFAKEKENTDGDPTVKEDEYHKCITQAVHIKARNVSEGLCYHPSFTLVLGPELTEELEPCSSEKAFFNANYVLMEALMLPHGNHGCVQPNSFLTYEFTRKELINGVNLDGGKSTLFVYFKDTNVIIEQDYNLQDFYAIVATLGGSIGLFFGWSFYGLIKNTVGTLEVNFSNIFKQPK